MDETDAALACILADCDNLEDMKRQIMKYAIIVQRLVCCMVKDLDQPEARIRSLYSDWADIAVEEFGDRRSFPGRKPH
jgi:hypothetical protein